MDLVVSSFMDLVAMRFHEFTNPWKYNVFIPFTGRIPITKMISIYSNRFSLKIQSPRNEEDMNIFLREAMTVFTLQTYFSSSNSFHSL
jgi:hypothetical protein